MAYMPPEKRVKVPLRRHQVEATGKPFYTRWDQVPEGLVTKTAAKQMKKPIQPGGASHLRPLPYMEWLSAVIWIVVKEEEKKE